MAVGGDLVVNLTGRTAGLKAAVGEARGLVGGFVNSLGRLGLAAQGFSVVARAVGTLASPLKIFNEFGDSLAKQSLRTGVSVEALSDLSFAAGQSGTSIEVVEKGLKRMATTLFDAEKGSKESKDALRDLGFSVATLKGLSPDQQFIKIGDALGKVTDASRKAALAQKIFGRAGTELLPLFAEGVKGIKALTEENRRIGGTISTEDAKAAEAFNDAIGRLKTQFKATLFTIGKSIATMFNLTDGMGKVTGSFTLWKGVLVGLLPTIALVTFGIVAMAVAIKSVTIATITLKSVLAALKIVLFIFSPTGILVTGLTVLTVGIFKALGAFEGLGDTLGKAFGGITDALKSGDIQRAWDIVVISLKIAFLDFVKGTLKGISLIAEKLAGLPIVGRLNKGFESGLKNTVFGLDILGGVLKSQRDKLVKPRLGTPPVQPPKPPIGGGENLAAAAKQESVEGAVRGTSEFFRRISEFRTGTARDRELSHLEKIQKAAEATAENTKRKPIFESFDI